MKEYTCTLINLPDREPLIDLHAVGTPADFYELFTEALEGQDIFDDEDDWDIDFIPDEDEQFMAVQRNLKMIFQGQSIQFIEMAIMNILRLSLIEKKQQNIQFGKSMTKKMRTSFAEILT